MRAALVLAYLILAGVCSLDLFREADFMYTLFFVASCSLLCALIATKIDSVFAELFIILQATAIFTYAIMALSYLFYDANLMLELNNINNSLLIADIIALVGVMLGNRWLYRGLG